MWRALLYLVLVGVAAWAAVWLANHPETISFTWAGREYTTSLAIGVVSIVVLAVLISIVAATLRWIVGAPSSIGRNARRKRRERGLTALSRGLVAVGSGDVAAARRYAGEAERLIGSEPLTLLLRAQAAQAAGQRDTAEAAFRRMAELPDTKVLGLRGLYLEARRRGDAVSAREHAEAAAEAAPAVAWANEAVLDGYSADRNWPAALRMVERRASLGLVDKAASRRQRAVLHTADALEREEENPHAALDAAVKAVELAPDLVPAAALAGRLLAAKGDLKRAARIIETAWRTTPHPDLAAAYMSLRSGDSAADRLKRAEALARMSSWAPESRLAIARAAIEARDLPRARATLQPLLHERPTMRVCFTMADLEGQEGRTGRVREWLARAARAPRDQAWIADGIVSETWAPVSPVTGRLDAFAWGTPPEVLGAPARPEDLVPPEDDPGAPPPSGLPSPTVVDASADISAPQPASPAPPDTAPPDPAVVAPATPAAVEPSRPRSRPMAVGREPEPVVFPVAHAPDDPGAAGGEGGEEPRSRFRLIG